MSNPDLPIEVRAPETFLFDLKKKMVEWGYSEVHLWVDKVNKKIIYNQKDFILGVHVENSVMKVAFGDRWENRFRGAAFDQLLKDAQDKLQRPLKGKGKGPPGKAGKLPVESV